MTGNNGNGEDEELTWQDCGYMDIYYETGGEWCHYGGDFEYCTGCPGKEEVEDGGE